MPIDSPRSLPRAIGLGLLIGLVFALLLAIAAFFGVSIYEDVHHQQGSWSSLGAALALLYGIAIGTPLLILAGGVLGGCWLRKRRRRRFTFLWFPLSLLPVAALAATLGFGLWHFGGRAAYERLQQARHLHWAIANRSPDDIFSISFFMDPTQAPDGYAWQHFTPDLPVELQPSETVTPGWSAKRTVLVSWQRVAPCGAAVVTHCGGDGELLQARVTLPHYGSRWNKAYVLVFLPHDRVGVEVVDSRDFDGRVNDTLPEAQVAKGVPAAQQR